MNFNLKSLCSFLLLAIIAHNSFGQLKEIDSIKLAIRSAKEDTNKVNSLLLLSKKYFNEEPEEAIKIANQARNLAEKIKFKKGEAYALKNIGIGYYMQGKYLETFEHWNISMKCFDALGDQQGVANILSNIGSVYFDQGDDANALDNYLKSLKISEAINDSFRITTALGNIGNVYLNKNATLDKALAYYLKALPISYQLADNNLVGTTTVGIGEVYFKKENFDSALYYFNKSLIAYNGTEAVPYSLNQIGRVYTKRKNFQMAVENHSQAYELGKKLDAKLDMIQSLLGLGASYYESGDFKKAVTSYSEAETLSLNIGLKGDELKETYQGLAVSFAKLNDYGNAFKYQTLLTGIKDTLYNLASDKKLASLQFDFDIQKKQGQIDLLTKDQELKEKEISRQKLVRNGFVGGFLVVLIFGGVVFKQRNKIASAKKRSDELLLNILPEETAEELKATGTAKAKGFEMVTVLFTDFKNFTLASEILSPEELVEEINHCFSEFDRIISKYNIEKIKTIGDAYMCAGGLPVANNTNPVDVILAGLEMVDFIKRNKADRESKGQPFFELRLGIHTGPVVAGIVGIKKFAYDIWGDTVNTASRMESSGEVGRVNISGTTYEIVKDNFNCIHRGKIEAKNKGQIDMYFVESAKFN
jgi:class 3 adenylate cyclase/tetratricopeptide (TPR) repeat protein